MRESSGRSAAIRARSPSSNNLTINCSSRSTSIFLLRPFFLGALLVYKVVFPGGFCDSHVPHFRVVAVSHGHFTRCLPGSVRLRKSRQALCGGVLLQSQVVARGRVFEAIQEKSLPGPQEGDGDGTDREGLGGSAALPCCRRRALGLPRDHCLQECGCRQRAVR